MSNYTEANLEGTQHMDLGLKFIVETLDDILHLHPKMRDSGVLLHTVKVITTQSKTVELEMGKCIYTKMRNNFLHDML